MPYIDKNHFNKLRPNGIISLVPSITELLYDLGLVNEVIGITKFCVHPETWLKQKNNIGGTKKLNFKKIENLNPNLIIANKEENVQDQIETLCQSHHVYLTDINTYEEALQLILDIGELTGTNDIANNIHALTLSAFKKFQLPKKIGSCLYLIWNDPVMAAGKNTYIDAMLTKVGFENILQLKRYPELDSAVIESLKPDYVLLSSEPYPFNEKHLEQFSKIFPTAKVKLVDGEMFSWYGSRMQKLPGYIFDLFKHTI
jgi:ABC-type Fe3+-hydroxamate transport system substrate-binding protein